MWNDASARAATALLAALLFWAPLPFGSVVAWAETVLLAGACLALALAAANAPTLRPVALPAAALVAIAALGWAQARAWPAAVVAAVSPEHLRLYGGAADLLAPDAATPLPTLSLAPDLSRAGALSWLLPAAALVAAAAVGWHRSRRRVLAAALVAAGLFEILYGARRWFAGATSIWDREVPGDPSRLRGTFINPDHLAVFLEIVLPVVFAGVWWGWRRARDEPAVELRLLLAGLPALLWLTVFVGLAFTGSRGGLAAAIAGAVGQGVLLAAARGRWRLAPLGAFAAIAGLGVVAGVGLQEGLGRLIGTSAYEVTWGARQRVYAATVELWERFPWLGTGLATFRDAFPMVHPPDLGYVWWHAHNDPLELLATTGVVGAVLMAAGLVALVLRLGTVLRHGRRSEDRAAALAALGALGAVLVHEFFDFGLTMPANALALAVVAGAAAAARCHRDAADGLTPVA
jgi:O-antigen ligase/polysaccharide polymerase Wzy-like membrane protein